MLQPRLAPVHRQRRQHSAAEARLGYSAVPIVPFRRPAPRQKSTDDELGAHPPRPRAAGRRRASNLRRRSPHDALGPPPRWQPELDQPPPRTNRRAWTRLRRRRPSSTRRKSTGTDQCNFNPSNAAIFAGLVARIAPTGLTTTRAMGRVITNRTKGIVTEVYSEGGAQSSIQRLSEMGLRSRSRRLSTHPPSYPFEGHPSAGD